MFAKYNTSTVIVKALFKNLFDILPKIYRYRSCRAKYSAGYPVSAFVLAGYPSKTVSGTTLIHYQHHRCRQDTDSKN
jgi:hypothetical protein